MECHLLLSTSLTWLSLPGYCSITCPNYAVTLISYTPTTDEPVCFYSPPPSFRKCNGSIIVLSVLSFPFSPYKVKSTYLWYSQSLAVVIWFFMLFVCCHDTCWLMTRNYSQLIGEWLRPWIDGRSVDTSVMNSREVIICSTW